MRYRYGINIEPIWSRGFSVALFWRGLTHYYGIRCRVYSAARWPTFAAWRGLPWRVVHDHQPTAST